MPRYLIEVPHDPTTLDCVHAIEVFHRTGSHFLTHADWGCRDGEHKAWLIVDAETRDEARNVVPPEFRPRAHVVGLNTFTQRDLAELQRTHRV